jgi:signal transduction histidine kinase
MSKPHIPWQQLIDTAPDGLFVLDAENRVQYANAAALTLLGLPSPAGLPAAEWLAGLSDQNCELLLQAIEEGGQVRLHLPDAKHRHLVFESQPLIDVNGILARVRRDYEVEASEVIALTVHELRIPMTSIMGYAKMLFTIDADSLSDMQRQFLDTIQRNVERLNDDLSAVQEVTRIDRAKLRLILTPQSVAKVAGLALEKLGPLVAAKGHQVTLDLPDDLPHVHADAERLEQILHILLDNALKYTPAGGRIRVHGRAAGGLVQIGVTDNGIGISPTEQERVFSKFFRGEDERIREYTGLGLDLYIARGLVRLQGGRLWFESTPGQGSTFSFTLPGGEA